MRERRGARVGTVSGLALLTGGTAVAAVTHGASSIFPTIMLGLLAAGLGHALGTEIQRQARRGTAGWAAADTINAALLTAWTAGAMIMTLLPATPLPVRAVGLLLSFGYALSSAYFITERHRTLVHASASEKAGAGHHTASTEDSTGHEQSQSAEATKHAPTPPSAPDVSMESASAPAPPIAPAPSLASATASAPPIASAHSLESETAPAPPIAPVHCPESVIAPAHTAAPAIPPDSAIDSVPAEPVN
ncbi:hypothetical protein AB0368_18380 [Actinoplanes sp. NPDC051475]|uniref:hypothetical protein n=1 Tax=Actinoplanes sp. NPDC051475 TaxID=3157225 RepID=UPI00344F3CE8